MARPPSGSGGAERKTGAVEAMYPIRPTTGRTGVARHHCGEDDLERSRPVERPEPARVSHVPVRISPRLHLQDRHLGGPLRPPAGPGQRQLPGGRCIPLPQSDKQLCNYATTGRTAPSKCGGVLTTTFRARATRPSPSSDGPRATNLTTEAQVLRGSPAASPRPAGGRVELPDHRPVDRHPVTGLLGLRAAGRDGDGPADGPGADGIANGGVS